MRRIVKRKGGLIYPVLLQEFTEGGKTVYLAEIPDLPGCISHGRTPSEAIKNVEEARQLWIKARKEEGLPIPPPSEMVDFSGKFLLRTPKSLHRNLTHRAAENGVSLNQYAVAQLAEASAVDTVRQEFTKLLDGVNAKLENLTEAVRLLPETIANSLIQGFHLQANFAWRAEANVTLSSEPAAQIHSWLRSPSQIVPGIWRTVGFPSEARALPTGQEPGLPIGRQQARKPATIRK